MSCLPRSVSKYGETFSGQAQNSTNLTCQLSSVTFNICTHRPPVTRATVVGRKDVIVRVLCLVHLTTISASVNDYSITTTSSFLSLYYPWSRGCVRAWIPYVPYSHLLVGRDFWGSGIGIGNSCVLAARRGTQVRQIPRRCRSPQTPTWTFLLQSRGLWGCDWFEQKLKMHWSNITICATKSNQIGGFCPNRRRITTVSPVVGQ